LEPRMNADKRRLKSPSSSVPIRAHPWLMSFLPPDSEMQLNRGSPRITNSICVHQRLSAANTSFPR
jgi:hypothetical protein